MSKSFEELVEESDRAYQKAKAQLQTSYALVNFDDLKAQIEREARTDELNKLSLHQGTTSNGTDDIQVTLDYITKRLAELEKE